MPINFTGSVAGASFDWVNSHPSIGLSSSGTGNIASFISSNSGNSIVTAIITVTPNLNGCLGNSTNFNIVVNPTPNVNMILDQSVCNSTVIAPIVFAGTASTYDWTNSNTAIGLGASGTGNIPSFTATNNGTTSISAIISVSPSANGCAGNTLSFTITVNPTPVTPIASSNTPVCEGGSINLTSTAAIGADINWSGPNSYTSNSQNPVISPATLSMSGTYSVTVTNSLTGCVSAAGTTIVTVNPLPNSPIASSNSPVCLGDSIIFSTTVVTGAIYTWNGPGFNSSFQNPIIPSASIGMAGTYSLVITANGCTSVPSTVQVVINNCYGVDLSVTKTVNNIHPLVGNNVVFTIVVTNNGPNEATNVVVTDLLPSGYSYVSSTTTVGTYNNSTGLWTVGTIVNNGSETLTVTATVNPTGNYLNTASVTGDGVDPNNFNNASSVETLPEVLSIPEGFSPNGDGVNDVYVIRGIENYPNNTFVIFNRWGDKVYQANPYQNTWDGNSTTGLRVGGDQLPIGTYFFVLDLGDGTTPYKGTIYLNR